VRELGRLRSLLGEVISVITLLEENREALIGIACLFLACFIMSVLYFVSLFFFSSC
jgi:hypothetical protein